MSSSLNVTDCVDIFLMMEKESHSFVSQATGQILPETDALVTFGNDAILPFFLKSLNILFLRVHKQMTSSEFYSTADSHLDKLTCFNEKKNQCAQLFFSRPF
jgi:hypothetical protein